MTMGRSLMAGSFERRRTPRIDCRHHERGVPLEQFELSVVLFRHYRSVATVQAWRQTGRSRRLRENRMASRILVAVDGSAAALRALEHAGARKRGEAGQVSILVLNVQAPLPPSRYLTRS